MAKNKLEPSRLLNLAITDVKDDLDEKLERSLRTVNNIISGLSDKQANDALNAYVCKGPAQHEEIETGLFYSILVEPKTASRCYRDLSLVSRDGLNIALTRTNQIIHEKWLKLNDTPRTQTVWFCKELVKNAVLGSDSICQSLLRQISGGDVTPKNIWLTESVLDIFVENRPFLEKIPGLLTVAVYTYLRVIIDHGASAFANLRQREVDFCITQLREKWMDCIQIGRDLARLLQYAARIPEFELLWKDVVLNPTSLSPTFTGICQLMKVRTSRKFLMNRLTPDMENKLHFLITKVKFGQHKRYQEWFQRQYLSTPESQSLRCDLIRYICTVFHPSNELLCSDIIPRWAVIGWLLTTCTSNVAASNAKLALFYDWLFFDKNNESIMNIEPAILVMTNSLKPHPAITATLLDFLCRIMTQFHRPLSEQVHNGIYSALHTILEKRVLPSLSPLFDSNKLDKELRAMVRENFAEFCSTEESKEEPVTNSRKDVVILDDSNHLHLNNEINVDAEFSDEDEETSLGKIRSEMTFRPIKEIPKFEHIDIAEHVEQLDGDIKSCIIDLQNESNSEAQCEVMDKLVQAVIQEDDFDTELASTLSTCLCQLLHSQFSGNLYPTEQEEDALEDSIGTPFFVLIRNLSQVSEEDPARESLMMLIGDMYEKQLRIGYYMLYFFKVGSKGGDDKMATYKLFCKSLEGKEIQSCLLTDCKMCAEDDVVLFSFLIPDIYSCFPNIAIGSTELLHLIVSVIDGSQLQDLVCQILRGHLIMFRKDSFVSVLNASLDWETIEQYFLWQLIAAHNIPVEHIMPILPKLEFQNHAEALTSILIQLKQEGPSGDLLRPILCRPCKKTDMFSVAIIKYWAQEYEDKLAELLNTQLLRQQGSTPNRKRQRGSTSSSKKDKDKEQPSVEQILAHLDLTRQTCNNISFLTHETLQLALQQVQSTCTDALKTKYSDLFALCEDFDDVPQTRVLRGRKASNVSPKPTTRSKRSPATAVKEDSESSSESSDDEVLLKQRKKRKKGATVYDDSD